MRVQGFVGSWVQGFVLGFMVLGFMVLGFGVPGFAAQQRIVSLIPAVTEMLFAIGAGPQVVGVSTFDDFPAEVKSRAAVGGLFDPNFERILSLRPDLVIAYGSQDELLGRLKTANIPAFHYRHGGLADITATMRELGRRTGHVDRAQALAAEIDRQLAAIRAAAAGQPRPKTLIVFGREEGSMRGLFVSGGTGFLHDLLVLAGGDNVMADVAREGLQLSAEQLLVRAPEVIIELRGEWTEERRRREAAVWQTARIPAATSGRIHILNDPSLTIPGPRVVRAAQAIAAALR